MSDKGTHLINRDEVERLRSEAHMSLEKLAAEVSVDLRTVQRWLSGQRVRFDNIVQLAKVLQVEPSAIITDVNVVYEKEKVFEQATLYVKLTGSRELLEKAAAALQVLMGENAVSGSLLVLESQLLIRQPTPPPSQVPPSERRSLHLMQTPQLFCYQMRNRQPVYSVNWPRRLAMMCGLPAS